MSADNWAVCPRCHARREAAKTSITASYGVVPLDEFAKAWDGLDRHDEEQTAFREDYEIYGAETGTVKVDYRGECQDCGLLIEFKHEHVIPGWQDDNN